MSLQAKWVHTLRTEYRRTCRAFGADSIHSQNALRYLSAKPLTSLAARTVLSIGPCDERQRPPRPRSSLLAGSHGRAGASSSYAVNQVFITEPKLREAAALVIGWGC